MIFCFENSSVILWEKKSSGEWKELLGKNNDLEVCFDRYYYINFVYSEKATIFEKFSQFYLKFFSTGKSLSEAFIFASINPQYDNRLFMELPWKLRSFK